MLLDEKDIEISKKIFDYIELIASFNNNQKLKIDLDKLLANCQDHQIQSLIFKIKNELKEGKKEEEWELIKAKDYEDIMIKEVLKKIVPTFCQDIIASLLHCNLPQQYNKFNEIVLDIYKKSKYDNFDTYFENLSSKKNLIYTFSKDSQSILEGEKELKNKFGKFNSQNVLNVMSDSIKTKDNLNQKLHEFLEKYDLLIIRFTERDLFIINSISYLINSFEKENPLLKEKIIILIIHKQRLPKGTEYQKIQI